MFGARAAMFNRICIPSAARPAYLPVHMKRDIQSYRGRMRDEAKAERYARRFERGSRKRIDRREQRAVAAVFSGLRDCRTILDVPAGAGRFLATLTRAGRQVVEIDSALEILQFARSRAESLGQPPRCLQGDASRLPLVSQAVDAVFCNRLLHHILSANERAVILRELRRVCRRYVVVSFFDYQAFSGVRKLLKAIKGSKPKYEGQPTVAQFEEEAAGCGLRVVSITPTGGPWASQKYVVLERM